SQGATTYTINRNDTPPASTSGGEANSSNVTSSGFTQIATISCFAAPCRFPDPGLDSDFHYTYFVDAVNSVGTSSDSNSATEKPLPKPGCTASPTPPPPPGSINNFGWTMNYAV